jgi:hypothetical protein
MFVGLLITVTLMSIAWSIWIRRYTWTCRWDVAFTISLASVGIGFLLMTPFASATLGQWLHSITGLWNLEDYLGHDALVVASTAVAYAMLIRLARGSDLAVLFRRDVKLPALVSIPLLLVTFASGNGVRVYRPDFLTVPCDLWLKLYWVILGATLVHLLTYTCRALWIIRRDERSRRTANIYLFALSMASTCYAIPGLVAITPGLSISQLRWAVWTGLCVAAIVYSVAAGQAWRDRMRWFAPAPEPDSVCT